MPFLAGPLPSANRGRGVDGRGEAQTGGASSSPDCDGHTRGRHVYPYLTVSGAGTKSGRPSSSEPRRGPSTTASAVAASHGRRRTTPRFLPSPRLNPVVMKLLRRMHGPGARRADHVPRGPLWKAQGGSESAVRSCFLEGVCRSLPRCSKISRRRSPDRAGGHGSRYYPHPSRRGTAREPSSTGMPTPFACSVSFGDARSSSG